MSGRGGSPGEMPGFPRLGAHRSEGAVSAEGLLAGRPVPAGGSAGQQAVARLLAVASGPASERELAGQAAAVAAFVQVTTGRATGSSRPVRTAARRSLLASVLSARLASAGLAVGAAAIGGLAAAAFAGALPASIQHLAHDAIGAPAPPHNGQAASPAAAAPSGSPVRSGSAAAGKAGHRLCAAYAAAKAHGSAAVRSAAFKNLATAAGGARDIATFCASVIPPGSPSAHPSPTSHPTGQPSPRPTGQPSPHPTGQPSPHPTGPPSPHPTGPPSPHPTGKPSKHPHPQPSKHPHGPPPSHAGASSSQEASAALPVSDVYRVTAAHLA
jgi:hypothetical protein